MDLGASIVFTMAELVVLLSLVVIGLGVAIMLLCVLFRIRRRVCNLESELPPKEDNP
jgi:uncharacterized membrane protein YgaE (UPF0421/DUF939 family)